MTIREQAAYRLLGRIVTIGGLVAAAVGVDGLLFCLLTGDSHKLLPSISALVNGLGAAWLVAVANGQRS